MPERFLSQSVGCRLHVQVTSPRQTFGPRRGESVFKKRCSTYMRLLPLRSPLGIKDPLRRRAPQRHWAGSEELVHCSTMLQPESGSNAAIAVADSVVAFPKSFWSSTPSWFIMKVMTPELPYSAG